MPANFKRADGITPIEARTTFSRIHRDTIKDNDTFDGMLCGQITLPYPATVAATGGFIDTKHS